MKSKLIIIVLCLIILCGIFIRNQLIDLDDTNYENDQVKNPIEQLITRAQVAKMLSFTKYTKDECNDLERVITYTDTKKEDWYDKYINAVNTLGVMKEKTNFRPNEALSYGEAKKILEQLKLTDYKRLRFSLQDKESKKKVTVNDWLSIYEYICTELHNYVPEEKDIFIVMATDGKKNDDSQGKNEWTVTGEDVTYQSDGISVVRYLNKTVTAIVNGDEILAIKQVKNDTVLLKNVWIISAKKQTITIFVNGIKKSFESENKLAKDLSDIVGDLIISNQKVTKVSVKPNKISGKVLAATKDYIELEKYGKVYLDDGYKIYKTYGDLESKVSNAVLVGYSITDFVMSNDKISAALIKESPKTENIRVILKTSEFKGIFHKKVEFTADKPFTIKYGKKEKNYKAKEVVTINKNSKFLTEGQLKIIPQDDGGKITIKSLNRAYGSPSYHGTIEIATYDEGLVIVNELPLEEYLYSVVPSEMPTTYGDEALKVQAVCARSFAYNQLISNQYSEYGAHVDDSMSFQVYNNVEENKSSIKAVKDTYGKVLNYDGQIITAYYFSTSCGYTSSANEVWMNNSNSDYLSGKLQVDEEKNKTLDLTNEKNFRDFLINKDYKTYDSDFAWYRWHTNVSLSSLKATIDSKLLTRYNANSKLIKTLVNGSYVSIPINTVGDIKSIKITKRATGGIATEAIIKGTKNTIKIISEYNIRILLSPSGNDVIRQDDSKVSNMNLLPSAFIILDQVKKDGKVTGYTIRGGGYGHGVGMSQNGVKTMVDDGFDYTEILQHYYSGVQLSSIY